MQIYCRLVFCCTLLAAAFGFSASSRAEVSPRLYSVEVSAEVQTSPAQVRLQWPADPAASGYTVHRKTVAATSWTLVGNLPGAATSYVDQNVTVGTAFEYQILKSISGGGYSGSGYIYAGINAPVIENRGKLILLVDSTHATTLAPELARLQQDLVGDGWIVIRHDVPRSSTPPQVKALVKAAYDADPANVKSLFIFGHVAVPYSGNLAPDGHPDHNGAWAADTYYADMNGSWTDSSVNNTGAEKPWNDNIPGDGKFDQSNIPSDLELQVGRVDLYNMTCYANKTPSRSELDLLRNYLNKDHNFRHGKLPLPRRGLVCDNFGESWGEAFASSGWRNFAPAFGAASNVQVPYGQFFPTLNSQGYLWAYGTGGGSWYTCNGVGGSDDFALGDIKAVFTLFLGSYFGDWDNESAFLRAPLGSSTYTLASAWAGRPHWFMHHMALGEPIGYSARLSQNNNSLYTAHFNGARRQVHTALLGDPTIRLHPVIPPSNVTAGPAASGVTVSWQSSPDSSIQGYLVYRTTSVAGPFSRVSGNAYLSSTSFNDTTGTASHVYMVRAVKLEQSGSGTYFNPSQGVFSTSVSTPDPTPQPAVPAAPSILAVSTPFPRQAKLTWRDNSGDETGFEVYRRTGTTGSWVKAATLPAGATACHINYLVPSTTYYFRVLAINAQGASPVSNQVVTTMPSLVPGGAGGAVVYRIESSTKGNWANSYGAEGHRIVGVPSAVPNYVSITPSGHTEWTWNASATDPAALLKPDGSGRIAAAWYAQNAFSVTFSFNDTNYHRTALYFLDWEATGREQIVNVYDANTGTLFSSRKFTGFSGGTYIQYELKGAVRVDVIAVKGTPVLSGIFFGFAATNQAAAPLISPTGGTVVPGQLITMSTATSGATIRYTTDGSAPTTSSTVYTAPISLATSTTIKARAFKTGLAESTISTAIFTVQGITSSNAAQFLGTDTARSGSWLGSLGVEGNVLLGYNAVWPSYASGVLTGAPQWVWQWTTADPRALQTSAASRIASCAYASSTFEIALDLTDAKTHKVSFYFLDWDRNGRAQRIEIIDRSTGAVLDTRTISGFGDGLYLSYALKGRVTVRVTRTAGVNAVLSGIFFDSTALSL